MIKRVFRQMTSIQIASAATVMICLLIDSVIIARFLGVDAMSAYGLANPLLLSYSTQCILLSVGIQVILGEAMGRGDLEACSRCYSSSIVMALSIAAVWMFVIFFASGPLSILLGLSGASENSDVIVMTEDYLKGHMVGAPFYFLSQITIPYLQFLGKRRTALTAVIAMTVMVIIGDLMSVFVFSGGMFGIGLASAVAYMTAFAVCLSVFLRKDCLFRFKIKDVSLGEMRTLYRSGRTAAINQTLFTIRVYLLNQILLALSGTVAVAAFAVISNAVNVINSIGLGAGAVTLMLSSIFYSEEDRTSLYQLVREMVPYALRLIIAAVLVCEAGASLIMKIFLGGDPGALEFAVHGFRIYLVALIPGVLVAVFKHFYQGTGRVKFTNIISVSDQVIIAVPVIALFSIEMGLDGFWIGILAAQLMTLLMISVVVWIRRGEIDFTAEAYSMIGPDFGADPANVLEMSVTDMGSAVRTSERVNGFCIIKGLDLRLAMIISLCVEEITVNIVKHGFSVDDHKHSAEVRLVVEDDKCIIRIRDNCMSFDPLRYIELHESDDPASHIGIRAVTAMVSEINYINTLGLNNLYMRLDRDLSGGNDEEELRN